MNKGIYTLANDAVCDQLIAFLNSAEVHIGRDMPICIIPYDDKMEKIKRGIDSYPNVFLFDDYNSIKRWEDFAKDLWTAHSEELTKKTWLFTGHTIRKFCTFSGPFEQFVFYDVDTLAMKPLDRMFEKLNSYDFIFDDWEFSKPDQYAMLNYVAIEKTGLFKKEDVKVKMHGMDFFGSKKGIFDEKEVMNLKEKLLSNREIEWLKGLGAWDEVPLFNYMTFRSNYSQFNFTQSSDKRDRTGNCANADPFTEKDHVLYNQEGMKPIHRVHYMGYASEDFLLLSKGFDIKIPHKNLFLYYRFLKDLENMPKKLKSISIFVRFFLLKQKLTKKLKALSKKTD